MKKDQDDRVAEFYDHLRENWRHSMNNSATIYHPVDIIIAEAIEFGYKLGKEDK